MSLSRLEVIQRSRWSWPGFSDAGGSFPRLGDPPEV